MTDELMSQAELDALLSEHLGQAADEPNLDIDAHLSIEDQDILAEIGNISMGSAATALSTLVNRKVRITVPKVYVSTPVDLAESYPIPCIVVDVGYVQGLQGSNILVIREDDALVIGNLMMGEDGTSVPDILDELYLSAVTEAMNMMMGSAATAMSELFGRPIDISPPNTTRRNLALDLLTEEMSGEEPVVAVSFRMEIEDLVDSTILQIINIDFAKEMAHALLPPKEEEAAVTINWDDLKTQPVQPATQQESLATASVPSGLASTYDLGNINIDLIRDIPVQVRAILGRTRMSIDNILRLGPGHIMELESLHGEPIELFANNTLIARGEVVVVGEQFGVRITEIATPQDRIVSVR